MANPPITICVQCKYHKGPRRRGIWHEHYCTAITRPLGIDPVTGEQSYYSQNDLGGVYFGAEKHPNCRAVNEGNCEMFARRGLLPKCFCKPENA